MPAISIAVALVQRAYPAGGSQRRVLGYVFLPCTSPQWRKHVGACYRLEYGKRRRRLGEPLSIPLPAKKASYPPGLFVAAMV